MIIFTIIVIINVAFILSADISSIIIGLIMISPSSSLSLMQIICRYEAFIFFFFSFTTSFDIILIVYEKKHHCEQPSRARVGEGRLASGSSRCSMRC